MARQTRAALLERARGRWPAILGAVAGIGDEFLTGRHGPCPLCSTDPTDDRWRWDDRNGEGGGYCNQCAGKQGTGGAISGIDLVMRSRDLTFPEACKAINDYLGGDVGEETATAKAKAVPWRKPEVPPEGAAAPALGKATGQWPVQRGDGHPLFWIQRVPMAGTDKRGKAKKRFVHRVWLDGGWHYPSTKRDGFTCEWPTPRPFYGLPELEARPEAPVLLVEGETTMDAAKLLLPDWVVVAWPNGSKAVGVIDWSPMTGRRVVIWPDNDKDGQVCAVRLVNLLYGEGAESVAVVELPEGLPVGWDLGDADDWTGDQVEAWIADHASVCAPEGEGLLADGDEGGDDAPETSTEGEAWPFTMLGFNGDDYYYQPGDSGQVMRISRSGHSSTANLLSLARLEWWRDRFGRYNRDGECTGVEWQPAISALLGRQHAIGCYDPSRIRGVGAWWDDGRPVFHLGDRLIADGRAWPILNPPPSEYLYQRLPRRRGPQAAEPLSEQEGHELMGLAERFHWESKSAGILLAGWCALAPICGALRWRPHLWLNAVAGSGKSSVMDYFIAPLLADLALHVLNNTTEAGIRQKLRSDALPVVFDEAESNEKPDAARMQGVLSLARAASSEGRGVTIKGSPSAEVTMFNVRSMFLLSSISTSLKQAADRSRFSVLVLRIPDELSDQERQAHWSSLKADLSRAVSEQTGERLVARMLSLVGVVRDTAEVMATVASAELGSARQGDQLGTLLAGAWALQSRQVPTPDEALAWLRSSGISDQAEGQADERGGDQRDCLETILQAQLRVETGRDGTVTRTVSELLDVASGIASPLDPVSPDLAASVLGRHGLRVDGAELLVSNIAKGVAKLLAGTAWADGGWANLLASLPGARRNGMTRFKGLASATRAVAVPKSLLQ
jgi:putative DNA primase/helicase